MGFHGKLVLGRYLVTQVIREMNEWKHACVYSVYSLKKLWGGRLHQLAYLPALEIIQHHRRFNAEVGKVIARWYLTRLVLIFVPLLRLVARATTLAAIHYLAAKN